MVKFLKHGGLPFYLFIFISGLPIGRVLMPAQLRYAEVLHQQALEVVSVAGYEKTYAVVFLVGGLYLWALVQLMRTPRQTLALLFLHWPVSVLTLMVGVSALWAFLPIKAIMNFGHSMGVLMLVAAAAIHYRDRPLRLLRVLAYVLGASVLVHLVSVFVMPDLTIAFDGRWKGLTANANTLGALAFTAFWSNSIFVISEQKQTRTLHLALCAVALSLLVCTESKTALMVSLIQLVICFLLVVYENNISENKYLFVGMLFSFSLALYFFIELVTGTPFAHLLEQALGRSNSFTGRFEIWKFALNSATENLFFGYGYDDNALIIHSTDFRYISYHNGFLDVLMKGGLFSLVIILCLIFKTMHKFYRNFHDEFMIFSAAFVLALIVYNLLESTFVSPRNPLWAIFLLLVFMLPSVFGAKGDACDKS